MTTLRSAVRAHPLLAYYGLAFAVSWGGILLAIVRTGGIPATPAELESTMVLAVPGLLVGPTLAGLLLTGLAGGRAGYRELVRGLLRVRVGAGWYAVAVLAAPLLMTGVLLVAGLSSPGLFPGLLRVDDPAARLRFGLVVAAMAGVFEELGWTGFAVPRLRRRHGVLATGLVAGVLWGAWHVPANVVLASGTYAGGLSLPVFFGARGLGDLLGLLVAFRVLMVWVHDRTGSLLLAILMHGSLTFATIVLEPVGISGRDLIVYDVAMAAAFWAAVAALAPSLRPRPGAGRPVERPA